MQPRLDFYKASPESAKAMIALEGAVVKSGLEPELLELVKLRASQINGCAYCVDMHSTDARKRGETERRLHAVVVWRESPFFTERERAALAWTEAVTRIHGDIGDELYDALRAHFSDKEIVDLTLAVVAINSWNRMAISFRTPPGSYKP
jgi:AhpD family alkylhydroperoxidase